MKHCLLALFLAGPSLVLGCGSDPNPDSCELDADCDDGNGCTTGVCAADGTCTYQDVVCDDGLFCNGAETCDPATGTCQAGLAPEVDDALDCTVDSCDEDNDTVVHTPDHGRCADELFCNGEEVCDVALGCVAGEAPGDGVACTDDACDEATDTIVSSADDSLCDDGLFCNGVETCDPVAGCLAGTAPGDGIGCTVDMCDESTDTVMGVPDDTLCDDGDTCTTTDICDPVLDCVHVADIDPVCGTCDNCGFETGDFTDWDTQDLAMPFDPLRVETLGGGGGFFWTVDPPEGVYAAYHGFDGTGPGTIEVGQDISIHPSVASATLTFDYRAAWDMTFGATLPRTFAVHVEPAGGGIALQTETILTADPGQTTPDTGAGVGDVDLSDHIGQTVYMRFVWDIPEPNTGPGAFELDNVVVTSP